MIGAKEAVAAARAYAHEVIDFERASVEEIERDQYKNRDVWRITLGFQAWQSPYTVEPAAKDYKSFIIDAENGEALAMKIRELTN